VELADIVLARPDPTVRPKRTIVDRQKSAHLRSDTVMKCSSIHYNGRISMHFPGNFRRSSTVYDSKFFAKIVVINSLGDAIIAYAAYTAFRRISVRFRLIFKECTHPKSHVSYSVPLKLSQLVVTLDFR